VLIDEIHTPDSSRYFYADGFQERQSRREDQIQLSKEFVRQFLISNGFQGKEGQSIPELTDEWALDVSKRYIHLYELLTGKTFDPASSENAEGRIVANVENYLNSVQV